jgi:hypothetical protein
VALALVSEDASLVRRCYDCGEWKPLASFAFANQAKRTRQGRCRACHARYRRGHYLRNRPAYIKREVARIRRYREENRALLREYLRAHPCVDCGETDIVVLQFDHRDPRTRVDYIGMLISRKPWRLILPEIAKCDVRCANCHRRRTAQQFNWRRLMPGMARAIVPAGLEKPSGLRDESGRTHGAARVCTRCGTTKPLDAFAFRDRKRARRRSWCRECVAEYQRLHYLRTRGRRDSADSRHGYGRRRALKEGVLRYLREHPCVDCGERDIVVLEFDHRDGEPKEETVACLMARGRDVDAWTEIAKCDVRCANCHQRRTARQYLWRKVGA